MKKFAVIALSALIATAAAPALALDVPTSSAYLNITPCEPNCLFASTISATTGAQLDSFEDSNTSVTFDSPAGSAEFDASTSVAYFMTYNGVIYQVNVGSETGLELLSSVGGLPTIDAAGRGLALDDATGILYLLYNDPDAGHVYLVTVDREDGHLGTPLEMPTALFDAGAGDFAILGGTIYVLTDVGQISKFALSDGAARGSISYPALDFVSPFALDVSAGGVLRVGSYNDDTDHSQFFAYDLGTSTWGDPVTVSEGIDGLAWYGPGSSPLLADTGLDSTALIIVSTALLALGLAVTFRRRASR